MLRRLAPPIIALSLVFGLTYACVPRSIQNLELVGTELVGPENLPDAEGDLKRAMIARREPIYEIRLRGSADWIDEVREHELNGYTVVELCDDPAQTLFSTGPYVGTRLISAYADRHPDDDETIQGDVIYTMFVAARGRVNSERDAAGRVAAGASYDLTRRPHLTCISIRGGAMTGAYGKSNIVRVLLGPDSRT